MSATAATADAAIGIAAAVAVAAAVAAIPPEPAEFLLVPGVVGILPFVIVVVVLVVPASIAGFHPPSSSSLPYPFS